MECRNKYLSIIKKGIAPPNVYEWCHYKRQPPLSKTCAGCNKEFQYSAKLRGNTKYCTLDCAKINWNHPIKGKKWIERSGENHHNWKGGITPVNHAIRQSLQYKQWRTTVYERDNYTCQICKKKSGKINADHIKPFSLFPELRFEITNGRTLCVDCHKKHGWSLFKENNPRKKLMLQIQENT